MTRFGGCCPACCPTGCSAFSACWVFSRVEPAWLVFVSRPPAGAAHLCPGCSDFWRPGSRHRLPRPPTGSTVSAQEQAAQLLLRLLGRGVSGQLAGTGERTAGVIFWLIWGRKYKHKYQPGVKTKTLKVVENNRKTRVTLPHVASNRFPADPLPCKVLLEKHGRAHSSPFTSESCLSIQ